MATGWHLPGFSMCVCVCVCAPAPGLLLTSGIMWRDMDTYNWVNKFYSCYMLTVVITVMGVAFILVHVVDTNPIRVS